MAHEYDMRFDGGIPFGSSEHFYHYLWGYLLPSLYQILNLNSHGKGEQRKFLFRSCGPVMDKITNEIANLFDIDYKIYDSSANQMHGKAKKINVARWDIDLVVRNALVSLFFACCNNAQRALVLKSFFRNKKSSPVSSLYYVREQLLNRVSSMSFASDIVDYADSFLILKRSPEHEYYHKGGKAEISSYGTGRRYLSHIYEARDYLGKQNIPVKVFEPGAYTLAEQITVFHNCKGVIGIIGAEFANVAWMRANSKVVRIVPSFMRNMPPVTSNLSKLFKLEHIDIKAPGQNVVKLCPASFEVYLK